MRQVCPLFSGVRPFCSLFEQSTSSPEDIREIWLTLSSLKDLEKCQEVSPFKAKTLLSIFRRFRQYNVDNVSEFFDNRLPASKRAIKLRVEEELLDQLNKAIHTKSLNILETLEIAKTVSQSIKTDILLCPKSIQTNSLQKLFTLRLELQDDLAQNVHFFGSFCKIVFDSKMFVTDGPVICDVIRNILTKAYESGSIDDLEPEDIYFITRTLDAFSSSDITVLKQLQKVIAAKIGRFTSMQLANVFLMMSNCGSRFPFLYDSLRSEFIARNFDLMGPDAVKIARAFINIKRDDPVVFDGLKRCVMRHIEFLKPNYLSIAAFTYSFARPGHPEVMEAICKRTLEKFDDFRFRDMKTIVKSMYMMGLLNDELIQRVANSKSLQKILDDPVLNSK